jgi:hypothetical protein
MSTRPLGARSKHIGALVDATGLTVIKFNVGYLKAFHGLWPRDQVNDFLMAVPFGKPAVSGPAETR